MIFLFILIFISLEVSEAKGQIRKEENLLIRNSIRDFGNVKRGVELEAKYYLVNKGETEIKINEVRPSCTCTSFFVSNYTVMPKDSVYIDLKLNTKDSSLGLDKLYVIIDADTETRKYRLLMKANIVEK